MRIPVGTIILWTGSLASIPLGWEICNGGSKPDISDGRFVFGANDDTDLLTTGGSDSAHTHTNSDTGTNSDHNHGGSVSSTTGGSSTTNVYLSYDGPQVTSSHTHSMSYNINTTTAGAHSHSIGDTVSETYNPVHISAIFIIKVS